MVLQGLFPNSSKLGACAHLWLPFPFRDSALWSVGGLVALQSKHEQRRRGEMEWIVAPDP